MKTHGIPADKKIDIADSLVTIKNGHFDVQTVMTAFDQTIRKSKDHSHIYIEELLLDEHGKISAQTGS